MKKSGFTLAEILISLMILGVIAALTIPSLIQNTQKKEEIVKMKKAISVLNQALAMDKALTGNELSQYEYDDLVLEMMKKRLIASEAGISDVNPTVVTQDGILYQIQTTSNWEENGVIKPKGCISTQKRFEGNIYLFEDYQGKDTFGGKCYWFECVDNTCSYARGAEQIINAKDPSKCKFNEDDWRYTCD